MQAQPLTRLTGVVFSTRTVDVEALRPTEDRPGRAAFSYGEVQVFTEQASVGNEVAPGGITAGVVVRCETDQLGRFGRGQMVDVLVRAEVRPVQYRGQWRSVIVYRYVADAQERESGGARSSRATAAAGV